MDFVKLYTDVLTHPKWMVLSPAAKAALVQAWMYAGRHETDGYVPSSAASLIGMTKKAAAELEGTWTHQNGAGWHLHDWQDHQEGADEIKRRRVLARDRKRAERARQRGEETS